MFTIGIHFHDGTKNYDKQDDRWDVVTRFASMASRDSKVEKVLVNCEGITQRIYKTGQTQTWRPSLHCPHHNH